MTASEHAIAANNAAWSERERMKLSDAVLTMQARIDEDTKQIEALTAIVASQHTEVVRCHERISELLRFNNEFEERARQAERKIAAVAQCATCSDRISFPRYWVEHTIKCLEGPLPSGKIGDAVFLLRDILRDALSAQSPAGFDSQLYSGRAQQTPAWLEALDTAREHICNSTHCNILGPTLFGFDAAVAAVDDAMRSSPQSGQKGADIEAIAHEVTAECKLEIAISSELARFFCGKQRLRDRAAEAVVALLSSRQSPAGNDIEAALREAFPHFQDDQPIIAEAIKGIGREYHDMVMNWQPSVRELEFTDQDGIERKIAWEAFEHDAGWVLPDEADWVVVPAADLQQSRDQVERCRDMLDDVPGDGLEEKLTKLVGDYLALQIMLSEARNQVERLTTALNEAAGYARSHHRANIGWWNDPEAWNLIEKVIKPALTSTDGQKCAMCDGPLPCLTHSQGLPGEIEPKA